MLTGIDKYFFGFIVLALILLFVFWKDVKVLTAGKTDVENVKKEKKKDKKNDKVAGFSSDVQIVEKWELPSVLREVSGIAYIDEQRFACVQDEEGAVYIFNRQSNQIEEKISFAGAGDFEGIAVKGDTAFIVRADGLLFEVDMKAGKASVKQYSTALTVKHNVEGLCYDKNNNRLLLAIKNDEPGKPDYKGIYAFNLKERSFIKEPVYKIDLKNELIQSSSQKKQKTIMPSAIALHPETKKIYIIDGPNARLLIMSSEGTIMELMQLGSNFVQPEGITFSPKGEIFISNEGTKQPGNILKIELH